jgi:hypothetical protein
MVEMSGEGHLGIGLGAQEALFETGEEERRRKAAEWLTQRWTAEDKRCPICQSIDWGISDVVELRPFHDGAIRLNDSVYPVFMLICNVCGYSRAFNAIIAGVITSPEPSKPGTSAYTGEQGQP